MEAAQARGCGVTGSEEGPSVRACVRAHAVHLLEVHALGLGARQDLVDLRHAMHLPAIPGCGRAGCAVRTAMAQAQCFQALLAWSRWQRAIADARPSPWMATIVRDLLMCVLGSVRAHKVFHQPVLRLLVVLLRELPACRGAQSNRHPNTNRVRRVPKT